MSGAKKIRLKKGLINIQSRKNSILVTILYEHYKATIIKIYKKYPCFYSLSNRTLQSFHLQISKHRNF